MTTTSDRPTAGFAELQLTEEQRALRDVVAAFLDETGDEASLRTLIDTDSGYDALAWRRMAVELGLMGLVIPENLGGSGASFAELAVVLEQMGRRLTSAPFFSTAVLATYALLLSDNDRLCTQYLPRIADGDLLATLAWSNEICGTTRIAGDLNQTHPTYAVPTPDGWLISGRHELVLDGHIAELILVPAGTPDGPGLFAVRAGAAGLTRRAVPVFDQTRRLAEIELADVDAELLCLDADQVLCAVRDVAVVALAAEQVGVAEAMLERSVEYAKVREQFGRPIGSFQAVKHRCANMMVEVEAARSAVQAAAWRIAQAAEDAPVAAAVAGLVASRACVQVTADAIQVHGGIGFTWEHPAHLYFKRARSSEVLLGSTATWRRELVTRAGLLSH